VAVLLLGIGIAGFQQLGTNYYVTPLFNGATLIFGVGVAGYASRRIRREPHRVLPSTPTTDKPEPALTSPGA
jgi:ribose transport system permease protein